MKRSRQVFWCGVFAAALLVPRAAAAQVTAADSAAVLLQAAQEFEREGEPEIAVALYGHITERYPGTPAAVEAQARLTGETGRFDPVSRLELPVFGTLYGLWLGVAVPGAFGADDEAAYGAGLLIGGPLGLFAARGAQRARQYSEGQARAITWGGLFGTWQGLGWAALLDLGSADCAPNAPCDSGSETEAQLGAMVVGGLAGIATGAVAASKPVPSGVSSAAQGGSIWGSLYGAAVAGMVDSDDGDAILLSALLAGNAGLVAGAVAGRKYDLTRPRVRWINLGALVGALGGLGIDLLVQPDNEVVGVGIPLVTSVGGLAIAAHATRDMVPTLGSSEDADLGALLQHGPGGWRLAPPLPVPAMLPRDDVNGRPEWRPGITLELLRAQF